MRPCKEPKASRQFNQANDQNIGRARSTISRNITNYVKLKEHHEQKRKPAHNPEAEHNRKARVPEATNGRIRNQTTKLLTRQRT